MIDEKINNSLRELEQNLKDIETARKQVERTVRSYNGLNDTTAEYVNRLGTITTKVQELITNIGRDYNQKVEEFEKDRDTIVKASNTATEKLSNSSDEFASSLKTIEKKLKYSLIVNAISLIAIVTIILLVFNRS